MATDAEPGENLDRAALAWQPVRAMVRTRRWGEPSLRDGPWPGARMAAVWPLSQVLAAAAHLRMLAMVDDEELAVLRRILERYRDGEAFDAYPGHRPRYYDDNAWVGLDLVQLHLATGETGLIGQVGEILRYLRGGEDPAGGVYWVERPRESRHTCSTAPTGELAARLHLLAEDPDALGYAQRCARFLGEILRREDLLYADNVRVDGEVDPAIYSYNQGTPVGLDVLLHRVTGERSYLERALASAGASLRHFAEDDRLWVQAPCFNAIYFRNLLALDVVAPVPGLRDALSGYSARLWSDARDPDTGWFTLGGIGRYERGGVLDQSGVVQVFAMQALAPADRANLC